MIMSKLSSLVKTLCKESGMKMKDVATKMGITPVTLSQNLAKDNPRTRTWENLGKAFGIEGADIMMLYHHPDTYIITHIVDENDGSEHLAIVPKEQNQSIGMSNDDIDITPFTFAERTPKTNKGERMPTESDNDSIGAHAEFVYDGNNLIADTFLDVTLLVNNLSALEERRTTQGKDTIYQSMLSVLIKQYGTKKGLAIN